MNKLLNFTFIALFSCCNCTTGLDKEVKEVLFKLDYVTIDFVVDKREDGCRLPRIFLSFLMTNDSPNELIYFDNGNFNYCSFHSISPDLKITLENNYPLIDTIKYKGILTNLVCVDKPVVIEPKQTKLVKFAVAVKIFSSSLNSTINDLSDYLSDLKVIKRLKSGNQQLGIINNKNYKLVLKLDDQIIEMTDTIALMKHVNNNLMPLPR